MSRYIWVRGRGWVARRHFKRRPSKAPAVITDTMEIRSQADGQVYDSKSRYRQSLKEQGLIEVGNERLDPPAPEPVLTEQAIAEAYDQYDQMDPGEARAFAKGSAPPDAWEGDPVDLATGAP